MTPREKAGGKGKAARKAGTAKPVARGKGKRRSAPAPVPMAAVAAGVHALWHDALAAHQVRIEAQFATLHAALAERSRDDPHLRRSLSVRIKPQKGRAKDLRRVEEALAAALDRLGPP